MNSGNSRVSQGGQALGWGQLSMTVRLFWATWKPGVLTSSRAFPGEPWLAVPRQWWTRLHLVWPCWDNDHRIAPCLAELSSSCTASSQFFPNIELMSALWKHSFLQCAHWLNLTFCPLSLPSSSIGVHGWVAKPNSLGLGLQELGLLPRNSIYISNIQGSQIANFHNI